MSEVNLVIVPNELSEEQVFKLADLLELMSTRTCRMSPPDCVTSTERDRCDYAYADGFNQGYHNAIDAIIHHISEALPDLIIGLGN